MDCHFHNALVSSGANYSTTKLKDCTCEDSHQIIKSSASASASDKVTTAKQNEEIISAAQLNLKLTLNDDREINLLEESDAEIMSTTNGVEAGAEGAAISGDPRRLSVVGFSSPRLRSSVGAISLRSQANPHFAATVPRDQPGRR